MNKMNKCYFFSMAFALIAIGASCGATAANLEIDFGSAVFGNPTVINNQYWPLISGTSFVYADETEDGCEVNKVTVTSNTKSDFDAPYDSIVALEVEDLGWLSEECDGNYLLMEETTDRYAQDDDENIWYLGEDTQAYDDEADCLTDEGSWEAGEDGAEAGIVLMGTPKKGLAYQQEFLEDKAEDMAKVLKLTDKIELESFGPFTDCLKTKEWSPLERGYVEHKFYCPSGGGLMLINELHGKTVHVEYIGQDLPEGDFAEDLPAVPACEE